MTTDEFHKKVQQMLDREAIRDCLNRYARGLDRKDLEMIRSVFHRDATDHHGGPIAYHPAGEALIEDWSVRDAKRTFSHHLLLNCSIDLDGDVAHTETYFQLVTGLSAEAADDQPRLHLTGGRYVDRFERRAGDWRIATRVLIAEFSAAMDAIDYPHHRLWARRTPADPSYSRPLLGPPSESGES
ncbi:hypothetical protein GCM10010915_04330 [Microbacterium faecale]|uniref:SnoaL-like domain-containing protein n=1 Tax=Microbacterium faecale TaxID=1804630 RepID=A0A916Y286_9MICO|nr:nuclear transport factor 2 family protein [Microbacterium faecale]GGD27420.1 hypothetical protein GCM10010915_04330 [Microbacterium faecale]